MKKSSTKGYKKYKYSCDVGSLAIGNNDVIFRIPNGIGDGTYDVYIFDNEDIFTDTIKDNVEYVSQFAGENIMVLNYDLSIDPDKDCLVKLTGCYEVFRNADYNGTIYLVKL